MQTRDTTCCGLTEIHGFPMDHDELELGELPDPTPAKFATLTQYQTHAAKILTQRGWRAVGEFKNRNTGNTVTIFVSRAVRPVNRKEM